jgi:FkbM family methyltransferase
MDIQNKITNVAVRTVQFKLYTFNRSLELCSRMNYETENLDFIDSLEAGSVLYDLGACEGRFTIYAALKGISVVAFEPNKDNYQILKQNIALNQLSSKVTLINAGVGESDKTAILQIGQPWPGGHQKVVKHDDVRSDLNFDFKEFETINIYSLDNIILRENLLMPDALKIDIDGSEVPFIKGGFKTLNSNRLKKVIFELDENDKNFKWIEECLSNAGFSVQGRSPVPNEPGLFNYCYIKR